uniref:(northern house mosquito) hypothetical protein n=1 Tax=Culex pipiens TaxID=7175 RepID=A0A8D8J878_CULPI
MPSATETVQNRRMSPARTVLGEHVPKPNHHRWPSAQHQAELRSTFASRCPSKHWSCSGSCRAQGYPRRRRCHCTKDANFYFFHWQTERIEYAGASRKHSQTCWRFKPHSWHERFIHPWQHGRIYAGSDAC